MCKDFADKVKNSVHLAPESLSMINLMYNRITEIPSERYFKAFALNSQGERDENNAKCYKLLSSLDFVNRQQNQILENYNDYSKFILDLMSKWNENFVHFTRTINDQIERFRSPVEGEALGDLYRQLEEIRNSFFVGDEEKTIEKIESQLLMPFKKQILESLKFSVMPSDVFDLLSVIKNLDIIILQWKKYNKGMNEMFQDFSLKIDESHQTILAQRDYFKETGSLKWFMYIR